MKSASWHCHHENLCEWDTEPRKNRIAYIKAEKSGRGRKLRLRLYQPMSSDAIKILIAYDLAVKPTRDAYVLATTSASDAYDIAVKPARDAYVLAEKIAADALEVQHRLECPNCPWNGKTIFPP
jgi:hypothetical protein